MLSLSISYHRFNIIYQLSSMSQKQTESLELSWLLMLSNKVVQLKFDRKNCFSFIAIWKEFRKWNKNKLNFENRTQSSLQAIVASSQ